MPKQDTHNEWFQPVAKQAYGGGSRCPCGLSRTDRTKLGLDPQMYSWGNYIATRWVNVGYCCQGCFLARVIPRLITHALPCGCTFQLQGRRGHPLPPWIKLPDNFAAQCAA